MFEQSSPTLLLCFLALKNKENDPARLFTNRGGALLKELKMKNAVEKGLPKVITKNRGLG